MRFQHNSIRLSLQKSSISTPLALHLWHRASAPKPTISVTT